jgi:hypothetical protein
MCKAKITPKAVKAIESALEERKVKQDRRQTEPTQPYQGEERRSGRDRRDETN